MENHVESLYMYYYIESNTVRYYLSCINRRKAVYWQGNSRTVNARLRNMQYARTGATELIYHALPCQSDQLSSRNVHCLAPEQA